MTDRARIFWLFGRSGAGKTTLAKRLHQGFLNRDLPALYLDGDDMRAGLCSDLGFSSEARLENHRRIAEMSRLAADQGLSVVVSTMAPEQKQRDLIRHILAERLVMFYIHASLNTCIQRDPKKLYRRAQAGNIQNLLDFPFDPPQPEDRRHMIDTEVQGIDDCYQDLVDLAFDQMTNYVI